MILSVKYVLNIWYVYMYAYATSMQFIVNKICLNIHKNRYYFCYCVMYIMHLLTEIDWIIFFLF
ncbi:hypothetical protein BJ944DRAFT_273304 [Cunninghamella echinulata]|nr:hypothetical protein BJ944DRAFT_273304 [Cunninghamella echinulata]